MTRVDLRSQLDSFVSCVFLCFVPAAVLPKSVGGLTDGSVESQAMHPSPSVGRPPGQRGRKPGKVKVKGALGDKASGLAPQTVQSNKEAGLFKVPKKRGPKPGSKVGELFRSAAKKCSPFKKKLFYK